MAAPPVVEIERRARAAAAWPRGTAAAVALAAAATVGAAALLGGWLELPAVVLRAAALAVAGGAIFLWLAVRRLRAPRFGAANSVTLLRAALAVLLAALVGAAPSAALGWVIVGLGTAGVALDGVDGALARHRDEAGTFGARFDMETDALLILVLAALVWQQGKAAIAVPEFNTAVRELPASALPHIYLARLARERGDVNAAFDEATRAVQLEPRNLLALRELGSVLLARGDFESARRFFVRALRVNPRDQAAMGWLACSLHRLGQDDPAARPVAVLVRAGEQLEAERAPRRRHLRGPGSGGVRRLDAGERKRR